MVRDRASPTCGEQHRPAACLADARDRQRHLLCDAIWLSLASAAERFATVGYNLSLVCEVPRRSRFEKINHALVMLDRERVGRHASLRELSSIARASRRPRLADRAATTRARRSTDASAMRSSTPMGAALCSNRIRRASRIAMVADCCCGLRVASFHSSSGSLPTVDMRVRRSP